MIRLLAAAASAAALLSACASTEAEPPLRVDDGPAQCRADQYQNWIGRNRAELPQAPVGETWRIACTTCAVTMDYNPNRLNIFYEERSGVIREVRCG